jgi:hypothetical protein
MEPGASSRDWRKTAPTDKARDLVLAAGETAID